MPELNALAIAILITLFLLWKLDFVATLLNLKSLDPELPAPFRDVFDAEKYAQSQQYTRVSSKFHVLEGSVSLAVLLAFWLLGGFGYLDRWTRSFGLSEIPTGLLFLSALFLGNHLIQLPFRLYDTFKLEASFGFNKTTPKLFITDEIKNLAIAALLGLPLLAGILWIFQYASYAWLWAWGFVSAYVVFVQYIYPSLVLPLFNKFTPMPEGELRSSIEDMAKRCQFPLTEISIMDGSKRSTKANAYFTGFGKSKRIALYDTLIEGQTNEEIVAVLAHEIGHFRRHHIIQRVIAGILQTGVLFFLLGLVTNPNGVFARELFDAFGVKTISPHVGLVLFSILFSPASRLLGVIFNAWSRKHEFEADAYAAQAMRTPEHLISALKKLSLTNLANLTPHPFRVLLDYSHPPLLQRFEALQQSTR